MPGSWSSLARIYRYGGGILDSVLMQGNTAWGGPLFWNILRGEGVGRLLGVAQILYRGIKLQTPAASILESS